MAQQRFQFLELGLGVTGLTGSAAGLSRTGLTGVAVAERG